MRSCRVATCNCPAQAHLEHGWYCDTHATQKRLLVAREARDGQVARVPS